MSALWNYVKTFEPARLRAVYAAVVLLVGTFGIHVGADIDAKFTALLALLSVLVPVIQAESTRANVVPVAKADAAVDAALNTPVPDPAVEDDEVPDDAVDGAGDEPLIGGH